MGEREQTVGGNSMGGGSNLCGRAWWFVATLSSGNVGWW